MPAGLRALLLHLDVEVMCLSHMAAYLLCMVGKGSPSRVNPSGMRSSPSKTSRNRKSMYAATLLWMSFSRLLRYAMPSASCTSRPGLHRSGMHMECKPGRVPHAHSTAAEGSAPVESAQAACTCTESVHPGLSDGVWLLQDTCRGETPSPVRLRQAQQGPVPLPEQASRESGGPGTGAGCRRQGRCRRRTAGIPCSPPP